MTIPTVPRALFDGANLDVEAVNENLRAISRNVRRNQELRYTTTSFTYILDGVSDTDAAGGARLLVIQNLNQVFQVIAVEARLCGTAGVTWAFTSQINPTWEGFSVATTGATNEVINQTNEPQPVALVSNILVTASAAGTITRGVVTVTILTDRAQQAGGGAFIGYTPTILSSTSSTAGSVLDTELTNAATAVALDTSAQVDARPMFHMVRNLASGGSAAIIIPSGKRTGVGADAVAISIVGPVGATFTATVASSAFSTGTASGGGNGVTATISFTGTFSGIDANAPGTAGSDVTLTLSRGADGGAVAPLVYMFVWWG